MPGQLVKAGRSAVSHLIRYQAVRRARDVGQIYHTQRSTKYVLQLMLYSFCSTACSDYVLQTGLGRK